MPVLALRSPDQDRLGALGGHAVAKLRWEVGRKAVAARERGTVLVRPKVVDWARHPEASTERAFLDRIAHQKIDYGLVHAPASHEAEERARREAIELRSSPAFAPSANWWPITKSEASYYCERLLTLVHPHQDRLLPALPAGARSELLELARALVPAVSLNCALRAAVVLQSVGLPGDAALIDAHRPSEPVLAQVFDDAARALRGSGQA